MTNTERKEKLQTIGAIVTELLIDSEQSSEKINALKNLGMPEAWAKNQRNIENKIIEVDSSNAAKEEDMQKPAHTSVRRRKDGLLELRYVVNGKQKSLYGKTQQEVVGKYRQLKPVKIKRKPTNTFEDFARTYFEQFKRGRLSEVTFKYELRRVEMYLLPTLGSKSIARLDPLDIQRTLNEITMPRTKLACYDLANEILRKAVQLKVIKENPVDVLERPIHKRKLGEALSIEEEQEFLKNIKGHRLEGLFKFLLLTGARRTEGINFRMSDIDNERQEIRLRGTKTELSDRRIPYFLSVKKLLEDFPLDWGDVRGDIVTRDFKKLCPNHKLHDLRHTFATRCLESGVSMKTVQIWLGHSTYEQTANTYSHVQQEFERKEAEKVNNIYPKIYPKNY
ncbi:MAG TPA: site-specific integrase [Eubacteriales bacterium]|nr:site-specific integrase [Eubacteriales bacterium]